MLVFTKRPYVFYSGPEKKHQVKPCAWEPVPKWVEKSELFQVAVANGNIKVREDPPAKQEKAKPGGKAALDAPQA